jgi:hypothetical protein
MFNKREGKARGGGLLARLLIKENLRKGKFKDRPFRPFESEEEYLRKGSRDAEPTRITSTRRGEGYWQTLDAEQEEALSIIEEALLTKRAADLKRKDKKFKSINHITANLYAKQLIRNTQGNPNYTGIEDLLNDVKKIKDEKDLLLRLGEARRRGDFAEGGRVGKAIGGLTIAFAMTVGRYALGQGVRQAFKKYGTKTVQSAMKHPKVKKMLTDEAKKRDKKNKAMADEWRQRDKRGKYDSYKEKSGDIQMWKEGDEVGRVTGPRDLLNPPRVNRPLEFAEGGEIDAQMADMMEEPTHTMPDGTEMPGATHEEYAGSMAEEPMVPDETMEEDFVDYVVESTLEPEDINYLEEALAADDRLSMIFDQIVETASEFSGSGPVEGPGTEMSDSIPARLSDGEFVITSKATDKIGSDNLQGMMEQAELEADMDEVKRQVKAIGGEIQSEVEKVSSTVVEEDPIRLKNKEAMRALDPRLSLFAS